MIIRFICHCKNWNAWRKHNRNNKLHKIYIFFKPQKSPTFMQTNEYVLFNGKIYRWSDVFMRGFYEGLNSALTGEAKNEN